MNGENYRQMWKVLDNKYGTKHVLTRCIRDKANKIPHLDKLNLKAVEAFYFGVTVQVNYYLVNQPQAVTDENSLLFSSKRQNG